MSKSEIVLASSNPGKLRELQALLAPLQFSIRSQSEYGVEGVEETGLTFVENAIIKARHAAQATGLPSIADDSGLEVDALKGAPGIYSARYAGPNASDEDNTQKLLRDLVNVPKPERRARFRCLVVFLRHALDPTPIIAQGTWEGTIAEEPRGENGFGYDPVFWVPSRGCTAAELGTDVKNRISHRGQALAQLQKQLS